MKKITVDKKNLKKGAVVAGGIALLAAVSALCVKGMKVIDQKLKAKKELQDFEEEILAAEEVVAEEVAAEEAAEEVVAEEPAEEEQSAE